MAKLKRPRWIFQSVGRRWLFGRTGPHEASKVQIWASGGATRNRTDLADLQSLLGATGRDQTRVSETDVRACLRELECIVIPNALVSIGFGVALLPDQPGS